MTATRSRSSRSSKPGTRQPAAPPASTLDPASHTLLLSEDPPLSLLDRWIRLLDRSPSRGFFYLALPAALILAVHLLSWSCAVIPFGNVSPQLAATASMSILFVGIIHYAGLTAVFLPLMLVVAQQVVGRLLAG